MPPTDFVSQFIEFTKDFESPTSFWKWSAYGAIAATLRFNCYVKWGSSNLYPNLYILLLADSATSRKDAGPELVEDLLKECNHTKVISGRASWQGIVDELSNDIGRKTTGVPVKFGAGIIIATEFTAAFVEDPSLIKLMTEAYAYKEEYEYILRGGKVKIKKRCLTLLAGSNETLLRDFYTSEASYGGLLRRTCIIKADKRRPPNSFQDDGLKDHLSDADKKQLIAHLKTIEILNGEFHLTLDAKKAWKEFYNDLYNSYEKIEDKSGFIQGAHSIIFKLAMIIAASYNTLEISERIIMRAVREIIDLKENYSTYIMGSGKNAQANISAVLLMEMWKCNGTAMKRRDMLFKHWNEISAEDLDKLILTLEGAGLIKLHPSGVEPAWNLTERAKNAILSNAKVSGKVN